MSPLGHDSETTWASYKNNSHYFSLQYDNLVAKLDTNSLKEIKKITQSNYKYKALDNTVLYAILSSRNAIKQAGWQANANFGVNIGSSRGATSLFEKYYEDFLNKNETNTLSSPTTTLGNISSWVAQDLKTKGPNISHSITCSTALHALLNGVAWIQSGMCSNFLVGGSEAPLTPFTIAQMQALKIYAKTGATYPCQALNTDKTSNSMILGEGAAMACLAAEYSKLSLAKLIGVGYGTETITHNASLSKNAECFQLSMSMALNIINPNDIDIIVTHTPGTVKGDIAELNAIKHVFKDKIPALTNNKWKIGHSLGTSGMLSVEFAILMLKKQEFINVPYLTTQAPKQIKTILINAVGFGGNAVSVIVTTING